MVGPNNITSDGGTNDFGSNDCKLSMPDMTYDILKCPNLSLVCCDLQNTM